MWDLTILELTLAGLKQSHHISVKISVRNSQDANFSPMIWHQEYAHSKMQSQIRAEKRMPFQDQANAMMVNNF